MHTWKFLFYQSNEVILVGTSHPLLSHLPKCMTRFFILYHPLDDIWSLSLVYCKDPNRIILVGNFPLLISETLILFPPWPLTDSLTEIYTGAVLERQSRSILGFIFPVKIIFDKILFSLSHCFTLFFS